MMVAETQNAPIMGAQGAQADDKRKSVKRLAMIFSTCTIADCPIESICITEEEGRRKVVCGYYHGSLSYGGGTQVVCGYVGS